MKKVVLLGTNHKVQYFDYRETGLFKHIVQELLDSSCAQVVLEEGDSDGERLCAELRTVGCRVAEEKHLSRINVAPAAKDEFSTTDSVCVAGTDVLTYGPVGNQINRENYMLVECGKAMEGCNVALFICGLAHLGSMAEKFVGMGFQVEAYEWQQPR